MIVGFHSNQLGIRGTEVALYDYAKYNIELLQNESIIFSPQNNNHDFEIIDKFKKKFKVVFYEGLSDLEKKLTDEKITIFYAIKSGHNDYLLPNNVRNCVHAVFKSKEIHGDRFAYISEWLSNEMSSGLTPFVPHIVELGFTENNLKSKFNIKENDIVIGRHGGYDTFDIYFAKKNVYEIAKQYSNIHFLFLNTENFLLSKSYYKSKIVNKLLGSILFPENVLPNIHFLDKTSDLDFKTMFINSCDAMLHARMQGETFGISCGEFSVKNKPVITCNADFISDRCHISILGSKGIYYNDSHSLKKAILSINKNTTQNNYDAYSHCFNKVVVMKKFKEIFLD